MRTPAEYEAEIDRLGAALEFEAKARASMAEAFARATDDLKAAEEKLKARDAFLIRIKEAIEAADRWRLNDVTMDDGTLVIVAITALLDDPKARGERALPLDMA